MGMTGMTVVEISECFPNKHKPVTGEFILQHVRALSNYCKVIALVPVRYVPSKDLLTYNPLTLFSNLSSWYSSLRKTESYSEANLEVIYFGYLSLPRPYFESIESRLVNFFFYSKVKKLLKKRNPDIIYCNWLRPWSVLSKSLADDFGIPLILDHHEDIPTLKQLFPESYKSFLKSFEKADRIVVHSGLNKNELLNEELKIPDISVCYLGQNFSVDISSKDFNFKKIKLICVSHLSERRKNIDILIKAFALVNEVSDFDLTIVGDGNLKDEYIELSETLRLKDKIHFAGSRLQIEIDTLLNEADIFVLPSFPEAFGVVLIEALAKGIPVITCRGNGGGEELKTLGYPAILVEPGSPKELSDAIISLSKDKNKMTVMSAKGKEIVSKYFTWDKNANETFKIIEDTVRKFKAQI
jgi:glycosyltransferase involved in cell wall biosynthesis